MTARRPRLLPTFLVAAAMLLGLVACGADDPVSSSADSDRSPISPPADSGNLDAAPLFGTVWWLDSATAGGEPADLSTVAREVRWQVVESGCDDCPDGPHIVGTDACNYFTRNVSIDNDTILWGAYWHSTLAGCSGGFADTMQTFFSAESFTYSISGAELQLSQPDSGIELTFQALETPFEPTDGEVVDDGRSGEVAYRLVWSVDGLSLEQRDMSVERMEHNRMGVGTAPGAVNALRGEIDSRQYLLGIMPADTTRVVYEPFGGVADELTLLEAEDPLVRIVGQFVDDAADQWDLVAYDADGNELDRLRWRASPPPTGPPPSGAPATMIQPPRIPAGPATTVPGGLVATPGQPLGEPQVEPLPGQVRLWVSNQSFEDDPVHLTIAIDGTVVVDEQFHVEGQHNWIPFDIDGLEPGDHQLTATSDTGVDLESSFTTVEDAPRWLVVDYWYYPGEEREFTITESDHAVAFS